MPPRMGRECLYSTWSYKYRAPKGAPDESSPQSGEIFIPRLSPFAEEVRVGCTFHKYCVPTARSCSRFARGADAAPNGAGMPLRHPEL
jgi:hypothetical protein